MAKPAFSASPTLLQVDDVDATVRCLHEVFGLEIVGLSGAGEAGEGSCGMLESTSGSVRVVVVPRSADVLGGMETGGCATLTLATDSVRRASAAAVRAGARLVRSHRILLPAEETSSSRQPLAASDDETQTSVEAGTTTTRPNPQGQGGRDSEETGMALLEGPLPRAGGGENGDKGGDSRSDYSAGLAVRVLLVDERLLTCRRRSRSAVDAAGSGEDAAAAAAAAASAVASVETGLFGVAEAEPSAAPPTGEPEAGAGHPAAAAAATAPGEGSTPPPLLEGFASLVRQSALRRKDEPRSSGTEHAPAPGTSSASELRGAQAPSATTNGGKAVEAGANSWSGGDATCNGHGAAANGGSESGSSAGGGAALGEAAAVSVGSWFSEEELLREREGDGDGVGDDGSSAVADAGQSGSPDGVGETTAEARETTGASPGSSAAASAPTRAPTAEDAAREVDVGSSRQATEVAAVEYTATNGDVESAKSEGGDDSPRSVGGAGTPEESTRAGSSQELQTPVATEADTEREKGRERPKEQHEENGRVSEENRGAEATGQAEHETAVQAEQKAGVASRAKPRLRQRPFRQLEAFMLGNDAGPLKASPNSIRPIPIDNQHFQGEALLMIKREPMDKSYAHMFEGKNRMFEVQVQGKFKKPPEGELYISLEITDMMKLGLLTRGLCRLLLSFGKKLNRRLHYSFGDKDNKELPHIAFPLVTSVDSLVCTPDGAEVPVLGRPFEEDKQSKASRKSGVEDNAKGIGKFQTGFTYSFSFHSMYIDMAQWSTCKIPVMRDVDLHTFWGNSALRIAAYVIKPSSSAFTAATASHLQSELEYVFCVQVRHLPQSELGDGSEEEDWEEEGELEGEGDEGGTQEAVMASATAATAQASKPETVTPYEDEERELVNGEKEAEEEGEEGEDEDGFILDGEGGTAEIGDEIALPLLTDREPSPRGRQKSASRWASNDDASDGEMEKRRERRRRRARAQSDGTGLGGGSGTPAAAASPAVDGRDGAGVDSSVESEEDDEDEDEDEDEEEEESRGNIEEGSGAGTGDSEQSPGTSATVPVEPAPIEVDGDHNTAGSAPGLRAAVSQPVVSESPSSSSSVNPLRATTEAIFDGGVGAGAANASPGGGNRTGVKMGSTWDGATRAGGTGHPSAGNDSRARRGQEVIDDAEEGMVRCPAYVDLYARSPKLQGTWTVFCVVKRGASGGMFALRSSKNVSILPANVVQAKVQHSPRLSRKERKRRKVDTVLQVLTAPTHAHANRQYQVIVRAVLGMESSADRAYRSYNPAPTTTTTAAASLTATSTGAGEGDGGGGGDSGDDALGRSSGSKDAVGAGSGSPPAARLVDGEGREQDGPAKEAANFSAGISVEDATRSPSASASASAGADSLPTERTPPYSPTPSSNKSGGSDNFSDGFTASANAVGKRRGSGTARRRSWVARSASSPIREGMVLRVLSEHHLSQQVAVLLPSSLTFSRPRKQCLRLSTRDIIHVELAGGSFEEGSRSKDPSPSSQLIPGMYLVEIHTIGRVHYMLVEGLAEARAWAASIHGARLAAAARAADGTGSGGRSSPSSSSSPSSPPPQISSNNSGSADDLGCISDPFSQYLTKKSSWKASNFWVLNCRRALDLNSCATAGAASGGDGGSGGAVDAGWGGGCWMDQGGLGGEVCEFVTGLLSQALELNDDSTSEQLITFLDDICRLRWMPLEGLSHNEQLSVFLNLYHVMLLHAFFILGPPGSPLRVASYFTTLCYEVGGDVLSLADLEHGVLRAKTSQPKQFLSKLIIPTTEYPFSLRQPEPRISFALNCGSASGVPGICIYRPDVVQEQLEDASTYYVQNTTEVLEGKRTVILPRIVYWYSADFSNGNNTEEPSGASGPLPSSSSSLSCLLHVKRYLVGEKRRQVDSLLSDGGNVTVKFGSWNWKCRPVTLVAESELENLRSGRPSQP